MAAIAAPRSPAAPSAATSTPVSAPTSSRVMSGSAAGRLERAHVRQQRADTGEAQAVAQELELLALGVERADQQDGAAGISGR